MSGEGNEFLGKIERDGKTAETVETNPRAGSAHTGRSQDSESIVGPRAELREEIVGIMASNVTIPAQTTVIARVNLETGEKVRVETGNMPPTILLESAGMLIPGIYTGRALSQVYDSKEFRSEAKSKRREDKCEEPRSDPHRQ
jgi:hypothetical protein